MDAIDGMRDPTNICCRSTVAPGASHCDSSDDVDIPPCPGRRVHRLVDRSCPDEHHPPATPNDGRLEIRTNPRREDRLLIVRGTRGKCKTCDGFYDPSLDQVDGRLVPEYLRSNSANKSNAHLELDFPTANVSYDKSSKLEAKEPLYTIISISKRMNCDCYLKNCSYRCIIILQYSFAN